MKYPGTTSTSSQSNRLLPLLLTLGIVFTFGLAVVNYFVYPILISIILCVFAVALVGLSYAFHKKKISYNTCANLLVLFLLVLLLPFSVYLTGGLHSTVMIWYVLIPIGGLLIFNSYKKAIIYTVIALASALFFVIAEYFGLQYPPYKANFFVASAFVNYTGLIIIAFFITRYFKKEQEVLLSSVQQEQALFLKHAEQMPGIIYQYQLHADGSNGYIYISDGIKEMMGIEAANAIADATLVYNIILPEDFEEMRRSLVYSAKTLNPWVHESRIRMTNGNLKWIKGNAKPERMPDGSTIWYGYAYDKTEEKTKEQHLAESENNFRQISDTINDIFYLYDIVNKKYLFISPNCKDILGVEDKFFYEGSSFNKYRVHEDDRVLMFNSTARVNAGHFYNINFRVIINNEVRWFNEKSYPIKDAAGNTIKNSGIIKDITEQKAFEEKLLLSEGNMQQITSTINDFFFLYDCTNKKYLYVSPNCKKILGVNTDFFYSGKDYTLLFVHADDRQMLADAYENIGKGQHYEVDYRIIVNGKTRWVTEKSYPVIDNTTGTSNMSGTVTDITERKKAEAAILKTQRAFEEAQELANIGSWEFSFFDNVPIWSKEMYRIFDIDQEASLQTLVNEFKERVDNSDLKALEKAIQTLVSGQEVHSIEFKVKTKSGALKYVSAIGEVIKSERSKKVIGIKGTVQDITKQQLAAMAKSNFLSTMSHEIRTPINGVIGITNLLMSEDLTLMQKEYVDTLNFSAQHLSGIVSDILDFSKIESGNFTFEKVSFVPEQVCGNIFKLFEAKAAEKNIEYRFIPGKIEGFSLYGDYVRLSQILSNLLSNAVKFTQHGSVSFSYSTIKEDVNTITLDFVVKDTGIGIAKHNQDKVFESFLQADASVTRQYGGTGLGLTISKRLAELQGGNIMLESEPGKGTTFTLRITYDKHSFRNTDVTDTALAKEKNKSSLTGMKVLAAEDNKINVLVLTRFLSKWNVNYKVVENGVEAIRLMEQEKFDAVLMDLQMPVMGGREAVSEIRKHNTTQISATPVIALTADALLESQLDLLQNGFNDCITKPFSPDALFKLLQKYHNNSYQ
jgi:PAS domain S-box-containing protein